MGNDKIVKLNGREPSKLSICDFFWFAQGEASVGFFFNELKLIS